MSFFATKIDSDRVTLVEGFSLSQNFFDIHPDFVRQQSRSSAFNVLRQVQEENSEMKVCWGRVIDSDLVEIVLTTPSIDLSDSYGGPYDDYRLAFFDHRSFVATLPSKR